MEYPVYLPGIQYFTTTTTTITTKKKKFSLLEKSPKKCYLKSAADSPYASRTYVIYF